MVKDGTKFFALKVHGTLVSATVRPAAVQMLLMVCRLLWLAVSSCRTIVEIIVGHAVMEMLLEVLLLEVRLVMWLLLGLLLGYCWPALLGHLCRKIRFILYKNRRESIDK